MKKDALASILKEFILPGVIFALLFFVDIFVQWNDVGEATLGGWCMICCYFVQFTALALACHVLLANWARYVVMPILLLLIVLEALGLYVRHSYGIQLDGTWYVLLLTSSSSEIGGFIKGTASAGLVGGSALVLLALWCCFRHYRKMVVTWRLPVRLGVGVCLLLIFMLIGWFRCSSIGLGVCSQLAVVRIFSTVPDYINEYRRFSNLCEHPVVEGNIMLSADAESGDKLLCVYVIGESATRSEFSVYGYQRDTTPFLRSCTAGRMLVFSNVVAAAAQTFDALRYLLTDCDLNHPQRMNCTIADIMKKAGMEVSLVSAQNHWGMERGLDAYLFSSARRSIYLSDQKNGKVYDGHMLPHLDALIAEMSSVNGAIFLHQLGSHVYPGSKYPYDHTRYRINSQDLDIGQYDAFHRKFINHYDNSIYYTDCFLSNVVMRLAALHRPCCMMYLSDHGETPRGVSSRDFDKMETWEIPMVLWFSDEYMEHFPEVVKSAENSADIRLQSDRLLGGMLELARVVGYGNDEDNFLSPAFRERVPRMIMKGQRAYPKDMH